jgi:excisionase family DNA binding protein
MGFSILEKRFLSMNECSEFLGITKGTLYVWVCHKKIPYLKIGRLVKFDIQEIERWLKENSVAQLN